MNFSRNLAQPTSLLYERGTHYPLSYQASDEMTLNMILQSLPGNHFKDLMGFLGARTMYIHTHTTKHGKQASIHASSPLDAWHRLKPDLSTNILSISNLTSKLFNYFVLEHSVFKAKQFISSLVK